MFLLILIITCCIIRLILFALLHYKNPTLSFITNTVSDYGTIVESRKLYLLYGMSSVFAYIFLFFYLLTEKLVMVWPVYVLGIGIVGSILILFYPTDKTGSHKITKTGIIHWILAIVNFSAIFIFIVNIYQPHANNLLPVLSTVTWFVRISFYIFVFVVIIPTIRHKFIGIFERIFLLSIPIWLIIYSLSLIISAEASLNLSNAIKVTILL